MNSFRVFIGLLAFVIMGSLCFHVFLSPALNEATSDAMLERLLASPLYRASEHLALLGTWLCLAWGFEKMFLLLPPSWRIELESGDTMMLRQAIGVILGFLGTVVLAGHWKTLTTYEMERRAGRRRQRAERVLVDDRGERER